MGIYPFSSVDFFYTVLLLGYKLFYQKNLPEETWGQKKFLITFSGHNKEKKESKEKN